MKYVRSLSPSFEDYLEAIYTISKKNRVARSKDIAEKLNVKRPSVTGALKALAQKGLIHYEPHSFVTLSSEGEKIAQCVDKRHRVLREIFIDVLKLPEDEAEEAACVMEHGVSSNVCKAFQGLHKAYIHNPELAKTLQAGMSKEKRKLECNTICEAIVSSKK